MTRVFIDEPLLLLAGVAVFMVAVHGMLAISIQERQCFPHCKQCFNRKTKNSTWQFSWHQVTLIKSLAYTFQKLSHLARKHRYDVWKKVEESFVPSLMLHHGQTSFVTDHIFFYSSSSSRPTTLSNSVAKIRKVPVPYPNLAKDMYVPKSIWQVDTVDPCLWHDQMYKGLLMVVDCAQRGSNLSIDRSGADLMSVGSAHGLLVHHSDEPTCTHHT